MAEFCLIKYKISTYTIDGSDTDRDPDKLPVNGRVIFEPLMDKGDSVVVTEDGESSTITLTPIEARITHSELYHRSEQGVKLFAGGPTSNPERIRYRATFHNLVAGTHPVTLKPVIFEAEPGGELILSLAQPAPRQPYPGIGADQALVNSANEAADRAWEAVGTIATVEQIESWVSDASASAANAKTSETNATTAASDALTIKNSIPATVQSEVDTRVPPKVAEVIAGDTVVTDAAAAAVDAAADDIKWQKPRLYGTDLNTLIDPGVYSQHLASYATPEANYPESTYGTVTITEIDAQSEGIVHQTFVATYFGRIWMRQRVGGTWSAWTNLMDGAYQLQGDLTYRDLNEVLSPGSYAQPLSSRATAARNYPEATRGVLNLYRWGNVDQVVQIYYAHFRGNVYMRERSALGWEPWAKISGGGGTSASSSGYRRDAMKHASRLRRGGIVGTNGATPVALTFDHGYVNFRDKVLPHLRRLGLPCTSAFNQGQLGSGENEGIRWPELQEFGLNHGVEYAHHGYSHSDISDASTDVEGFTTSITQSIDLADTNMPELITDAFILPGVGGTNYDGFDGGWPWENWWEHPAGSVLMEHFPVISAKSRGVAVPMIAGEDMTVGSDRLGWDTAESADEFMAHVRSMEGTGLGVKTFMHPSQIGMSGKITEAKLVEVLEFLAAERDAGRVEVLTMSGFAYADPSTARRIDLAPESQWSDGACTITLAPLLSWVAGAQVVLETTATTSGPISMSATSDAGGLSASVTHEAHSGGRYRMVFTIPRTATTITLMSQGAVRACRIV